MNTINLQIPIRKDLKIAATEAALEQGFSSLQEAVRVFINKMAMKTIDVIFTPKTIRLSKKADKRYAKISQEINNGVNITKTNSIEELFEKLNED